MEKNYVVLWRGSGDGYLRECTGCGDVIYMKLDADGRWRPYESWVAGTVEVNHWVLHTCTRH